MAGGLEDEFQLRLVPLVQKLGEGTAEAIPAGSPLVGLLEPGQHLLLADHAAPREHRQSFRTGVQVGLKPLSPLAKFLGGFRKEIGQTDGMLQRQVRQAVHEAGLPKALDARPQALHQGECAIGGTLERCLDLPEERPMGIRPGTAAEQVQDHALHGLGRSAPELLLEAPELVVKEQGFADFLEPVQKEPGRLRTLDGRDHPEGQQRNHVVRMLAGDLEFAQLARLGRGSQVLGRLLRQPRVPAAEQQIPEVVGEGLPGLQIGQLAGDRGLQRRFLALPGDLPQGIGLGHATPLDQRPATFLEELAIRLVQQGPQQDRRPLGVRETVGGRQDQPPEPSGGRRSDQPVAQLRQRFLQDPSQELLEQAAVPLVMLVEGVEQGHQLLHLRAFRIRSGHASLPTLQAGRPRIFDACFFGPLKVPA